MNKGCNWGLCNKCNKEHIHPCGMLGKKASLETRQKRSIAMKKTLALTGGMPKNIELFTKRGIETLKNQHVSWNKGKKLHYEVWNKGKKLPQFSGKNHPRYIDGRSKFLSPARYGDDWDAIRLVVYRRDKFTCQDCRIKGIRLDIHHKIPYLYSGDNSIENLITLCRKCHMKEEQRLKKEYKEMNILLNEVSTS